VKRFLRTKLVLSLAAFLMVTAAIVIPLSGLIVHTHAAAPTSSGKLWATGHDADFHCSQGDPGACHYLKVAVNFVMNGSTLPILALDHGTEVQTAINNAFTTNAPKLKTVDPRTAFASLPLVDSGGKPLYSAIIVASDVTCGGCDNNDDVSVTPDSDAINARAADIKTFFNASGGILALAGAQNVSVFYNFLPIPVSPTTVSPPDGSPGGFTLTSLGQSLGLTTSDINCCQTHNSFLLPPSGSPLQVAELDVAGNAETLISSQVQTLFVLIQGLTSSTANNSFLQKGGIGRYLQSKFPNSSLLTFSYKGSDSSGQPLSYGCVSTFDHHITYYAKLLNTQLQRYLATHANMNIYLIGHSMGGVIATAYLEYLDINGGLKGTIPGGNGGKIKGVVTLDSPLGGINKGPFGGYLNAIEGYYRGLKECSGLSKVKTLLSLEDLTTFYTAQVPRGGQDSISSLFGGVKRTNQNLFETADKDGIQSLTVGNLIDFVYDAKACLYFHVGPEFLDTQYDTDLGNNSGLYGRSFSHGTYPCTGKDGIGDNHGVVFTEPSVQTALGQFFHNKTPSALIIPPN
jgi:hypothetical protein